MASTLDDERVRFALDLVSTPSPTGAEGQAAKLVCERLCSNGLDAKLDDAGNVVCAVGYGRRSILLCGHMDTVAGWVEPKIDGGHLCGRGAVDAKGALLSLIYAFEELAQSFEANPALRQEFRVVLAAVVEEEGGSKGVKQLVRDKVFAEAAVFGEPSGLGRIAVGYRGHIPLSMRFITPEAHASAPWLTVNSAEAAYEFYAKLKSYWECSSGRRVDCVSVALTAIRAGTQRNVVPGTTEVEFDIRVPVGMSSRDVLRVVEQHINEAKTGGVLVEWSFGEVTEPYRVDLNSGIVRSFARAMLKRGVGRPEFLVKSGTGDMNIYSQATGAHCVSYGPGDPKLSHTKQERVELREISECSKVTEATILEYCSLVGSAR